MQTRNISNQIYEKILKDIVEMRLEPGSYLLERDLSEQLGVSRTPVREAIKRLTQDGWLIAPDRKRPIVKGFSLREGHELFQFRDMAESFALEWAFDNGMARILAGLLDLQLRKMIDTKDDAILFIRHDIQFHTIIIDQVGNDYLSRAWSTVGEEIVRISIYSMDYVRTIDKILSEHESLVSSLWDNRKADALDTLRSHHRQIYAGLERTLTPSPTPERVNGAAADAVKR